MKARKLAGAIALGIVLAGAAAPASSAVQKWIFQDDDNDFLYRPGTGFIDPNTCVGADCLIGIGDVLVSTFEYPSFSKGGINAIPAGKEVTGVAAIQYLGDTVDQLLNPVRSFGAYSGGLDAILALAGVGPVPHGALNQSAMIATYINDAINPSNVAVDRDLNFDIAFPPTNCLLPLDCISEAGQKTLIQVDGGIFADGTKTDPDNFWFSGTGGADISQVVGLADTTIVLSVNAGLSTLFNSGGAVVPQEITTGSPAATCIGGLDGCVDFKLTATINGGGGITNGAFATSTSIASAKFIQVPEPASLALIGAAMLGLGASRRRKITR